MLRLLTPDILFDSILDVNAALLAEHQIQGLLLDMDCTLKEHYSYEFSPDVLDWIDGMRRAGIRLCVLSNGRRNRVGPLAESLGLDFVSGAAKPLTFGLRAALARLDLNASQVAIIGDQIFADILAGRLAGIFTILVRPYDAREPWVTHVKRPLERVLLRFHRSSTLVP